MLYPKRTPKCLTVCCPVMKLMPGIALTVAELSG